MRIHSNTLTYSDLAGATKGMYVSFTTCDQRGSRKRARAFEVKLSGSSSFRQHGGDEQAATWDEWGIFLGRLFALDPEMTTSAYATAEDFHYETADRFNYPGGLEAGDQHKRHKWNPNGDYTASCNCGAEQRWDRKYAAMAAKRASA